MTRSRPGPAGQGGPRTKGRPAGRQNLFVAAIAAVYPDLFGLQDVPADQHDDAVSAVDRYAVAALARDDGRRPVGWAPVADWTDRFDRGDW